MTSRRIKKHNNGCNGKFNRVSKDAHSTQHACNKCGFKFKRYKKAS